jgi:hypothetical protein
VSASFCAAADGDGNAVIWNGSSWSAPQLVDPTELLSALSCPTTSVCEAVNDNGDVFTYNGSTWSSQGELPGAPGLIAVSCAPSLCVALDFNGNAYTYNGLWSGPTTVSTQDPPASLSCVQGLCGAVGQLGDAYSYIFTPGAVLISSSGGAGGGTGGGGSGGGSGGTVGGSGAGTPVPAEPSAATVRSALHKVLKIGGKLASVAELLKHGGFTTSFTAPTAGQLAITWAAPPHAAAHSTAAAAAEHKPKPVLVASARVTVTKAGKVTVKIRLTAKGKALLKHNHHLKVTALATFTPASGHPTSARKTLLL